MKKLIAMLLFVSMLVSAMSLTFVCADETATEPAEYVIRHLKPSPNESSHATFEIKGGFMEFPSYKFEDGVNYTTIRLMDKYNEKSMKFNFLSGNLKYQNVSSNQEWVKPAYYDIYFYHPAYNANDDSNAKVEIYHNGETTILTMNQKANKSQAWNLVSDTSAPLYFAGTGDEYIKITASKSAGFLAVGSIKIVENLDYSAEVPTEEPEQAVEEKPLITDVKYENGKITLTTNGSTIDKSKTVYAVVATYDKGTLAGVKKTAITIEPKSNDTTVTLNSPALSSADYKVYIFNENLVDIYNF